jgi:GntR family transcriptional regulator
MDQYSASRNTVRDAVRLLTVRGLVETRPGQGTFIVQKIYPVINLLGAEPGIGLGGENSLYPPEMLRGQKFEATIPRVEIQHAEGMLLKELRLPDPSHTSKRHLVLSKWGGMKD